jgi:hypothetical protein
MVQEVISISINRFYINIKTYSGINNNRFNNSTLLVNSLKTLLGIHISEVNK